MRNWSLLFFVALIPLNIFADIRLSSPQIKLNSQDQRVIEIKIQDGDIQDGDIFLNQYKSDDPINEADISYTLIEDFDTYQTFTIVLSEEYFEDYFSFKLRINDEFEKDIFDRLPNIGKWQWSNYSRIWRALEEADECLMEFVYHEANYLCQPPDNTT